MHGSLLCIGFIHFHYLVLWPFAALLSFFSAWFTPVSDVPLNCSCSYLCLSDIHSSQWMNSGNFLFLLQCLAIALSFLVKWACMNLSLLKRVVISPLSFWPSFERQIQHAYHSFPACLFSLWGCSTVWLSQYANVVDLDVVWRISISGTPTAFCITSNLISCNHSHVKFTGISIWMNFLGLHV